jgi:DNA-directed RNA polymerase specialized sigma24 family protein
MDERQAIEQLKRGDICGLEVLLRLHQTRAIRTAYAVWEQAQTAAEVWLALGRISPDQRAAVVARYFLGMSETEMSEPLVACPPTTLKWRLHAARARLRVLVAPALVNEEARHD